MIGLAPTFVKLRVTVGCYHLHLHHDLSTDLRLHCVCALLAISINNTSMGGTRLRVRPLPQQDHRSAYLVVVDIIPQPYCVGINP